MQRKRRAWKRGILRPVIVTAVIWSVSSVTCAMPAGGQITTGSGTIVQNGGSMTINQSTDKLGINWQDFNIGGKEKVNFIQPSVNSIALNRVLGNNPSNIYGQLTANGKVFLTNPNGIFFAPGAQVNAGGLVAAALNISDNDFQAGLYKFTGAGSNGAVINQGLITAGTGGYVVLAGSQVKNDGIIVAKQGSIALGAGSEITLDFTGDGLINLAVDGGAVNANVTNNKLVQADGGRIIMTARAADALAGTVINTSGIIQAKSIANHNGVIRLDGGAGGVEHTGVIDASAADAGLAGGRVEIQGTSVVQSGSITADGLAGAGGNVKIQAGEQIIQTSGSAISANSNGAEGGRITISSGPNGGVFSSATISATGDTGGQIKILAGQDVTLTAAKIDASGSRQGGTVLVGGDFQGKNQEVLNTKSNHANSLAVIKADAAISGNGGKVVVWSDDKTEFYGSISAKGGASSGDGGQIEVSGKNGLTYGGAADASAPKGQSGRLLLDPKNINVDSALANSIAVSLNTGTGVTLLADNDINVGADIIADNPNGQGGNLALQAGRGIDIGSNIKIVTDSGNIEISANESQLNTIIKANRDSGAAHISIAAGSVLDAGMGNISVMMQDGSGFTNNPAGKISISGSISGSTIKVINQSSMPSYYTGVILENTARLSASGLSDSIILATKNGYLAITTPANLNPGGGRWLVYGSQPGYINKGGLTSSFRLYGKAYDPNDSIEKAGNGFIYKSPLLVGVSYGSRQSKYYGDITGGVFSPYIYGFDNEDSLVSLGISGKAVLTALGQFADVGTYYIKYEGGLKSSLGSIEAGNGVSYSVLKRPITVIPETNQHKIYGDSDPALTYQVGGQGLVNGDKLSGSLARVQGESVGDYAITQGSLQASSNYDLVFTSGRNFTIDKRSITVIPETNQHKIYGDSDPALIYKIEGKGLVNGDELSGSLARVQGESVGDYAITQGSLQASGNYDLAFIQGVNFTIDKRPIAGNGGSGTGIPSNNKFVTNSDKYHSAIASAAAKRQNGADITNKPDGNNDQDSLINDELKEEA